jgi:hypothetical protein
MSVPLFWVRIGLILSADVADYATPESKDQVSLERSIGR